MIPVHLNYYTTLDNYQLPITLVVSNEQEKDNIVFKYFNPEDDVINQHFNKWLNLFANLEVYTLVENSNVKVYNYNFFIHAVQNFTVHSVTFTINGERKTFNLGKVRLNRYERDEALYIDSISGYWDSHIDYVNVCKDINCFRTTMDLGENWSYSLINQSDQTLDIESIEIFRSSNVHLKFKEFDFYRDVMTRELILKPFETKRIWTSG